MYGLVSRRLWFCGNIGILFPIGEIKTMKLPRYLCVTLFLQRFFDANVDE